jgi:hypothetical protein
MVAGDQRFAMQYSAWSVRSKSSPLTTAIEALARLESSSKVLWASNFAILDFRFWILD